MWERTDRVLITWKKEVKEKWDCELFTIWEARGALGFGGHGWRKGYVLPSHFCELGLIPVLSISCGLSLLLVLSLLQRYFSGFSGFPPSFETGGTTHYTDVKYVTFHKKKYTNRFLFLN